MTIEPGEPLASKNKKNLVLLFWLVGILFVLSVLVLAGQKYLTKRQTPASPTPATNETPYLPVKELPKAYPSDLPEPKDAVLLSSFGMLAEKTDLYARRFVTKEPVTTLLNTYLKYFKDNQWNITSSRVADTEGFVVAKLGTTESMTITVHIVNQQSSVNISFSRK